MKKLLVVLTAALCFAVPATAGATGTPDQQQTVVHTLFGIHGPGTGGGYTQSQTFTAGITGHLDQVDLVLSVCGHDPAVDG
jgi:hypothetical protein